MGRLGHHGDADGRDDHADAAPAPTGDQSSRRVQLHHRGQPDEPSGQAPAAPVEGEDGGHEQEEGEAVHVPVAGELDGNAETLKQKLVTVFGNF